MTNHNLSGGANTPSTATHISPNSCLQDFVRSARPRYPVSVLRPDVLRKRAEEITAAFPGRVLYAAKCNPDERVLHELIAGGVDSFDCASIGEIELIRKIKPDATIYFMHPRKPRESIHEAYFNHGIRAFVLDSGDELTKILKETDHAKDLTLFVRMAVPKQKVATDFSAKFGASEVETQHLLVRARNHCEKLGLAFHVGTQCTDPRAYAHAVKVAANVIKASGVRVDAMDVGGGFPADLDPANPPPPFGIYAGTIASAVWNNGLSGIELLCEPGRAMVAAGGALVVRVEGRKDDLLHINDGTYGGIFEAAGAIGLPYPAEMVRVGTKPVSSCMQAFRLAGPTCDSVDMMNGPFMLPSDTGEGDYVVLTQLGAYGEVSRTSFNGYDRVIHVVERGMGTAATGPMAEVA